MENNLKNIQDRPYRLCVGICLINHERKVFVAQRHDSPNAWQMPQGGIDEGETPEQAAFRELFEETNIKDAQIITSLSSTISYDFPLDIADKVCGGGFRGQTQYWFLMQFTGKDSDINLDTQIPEFTDYCWKNAFELPELIVEFKKETYKKVIKEFSPYFA